LEVEGKLVIDGKLGEEINSRAGKLRENLEQTKQKKES
jgi:hypothetical protein